MRISSGRYPAGYEQSGPRKGDLSALRPQETWAAQVDIVHLVSGKSPACWHGRFEELHNRPGQGTEKARDQEKAFAAEGTRTRTLIATSQYAAALWAAHLDVDVSTTSVVVPIRRTVLRGPAAARQRDWHDPRPVRRQAEPGKGHLHPAGDPARRLHRSGPGPHVHRDDRRRGQAAREGRGQRAALPGREARRRDEVHRRAVRRRAAGSLRSAAAHPAATIVRQLEELIIAPSAEAPLWSARCAG